MTRAADVRQKVRTQFKLDSNSIQNTKTACDGDGQTYCLSFLLCAAQWQLLAFVYQQREGRDYRLVGAQVGRNRSVGRSGARVDRPPFLLNDRRYYNEERTITDADATTTTP